MQFISMPDTNSSEFINIEFVFKIIFEKVGAEGEARVLFFKDVNNIHQTINFKSLRHAQDWWKKELVKIAEAKALNNKPK